MDAADTNNVNSKGYRRNYSNASLNPLGYTAMEQRAKDVKRFMCHLVAEYGVDGADRILSSVGTVTDAAKDLGINPFFPGTCDESARESVPLGKYGHVPVDSLLSRGKKLTPQFEKAVKDFDLDPFGSHFVTSTQTRFIQAAALYDHIYGLYENWYHERFKQCQEAFTKAQLLGQQAYRDPSIKPRYEAFVKETNKKLGYDCSAFPIQSKYDFTQFPSKFKEDQMVKILKNGYLTVERVQQWKKDNPKDFDLRVFPLVTNGKDAEGKTRFNQLRIGTYAEKTPQGKFEAKLITVEPSLKKGAIPLSAPYLYGKEQTTASGIKKYASDRRFVFLKDVNLYSLNRSKVCINGKDFNVDSDYKKMVMDRFMAYPGSKSITEMTVTPPMPLKEMKKESLGQFITDSANAGISICASPSVSMGAVSLSNPYPSLDNIPEKEKYRYKSLKPILNAEKIVKQGISHDVNLKFPELSDEKKVKKIHEISDVLLAAAKSSYFRSIRDSYNLSDQTMSSQAYMNSVLKGSYELDSSEALDRMSKGEVSNLGTTEEQVFAGVIQEDGYFDRLNKDLGNRSYNSFAQEIHTFSSSKDFGMENGAARFRQAMNDLDGTHGLDYMAALSSAYEQSFKSIRDRHDVAYGLGIVKEGMDKRLTSSMDRFMYSFKDEVHEQTLDSALNKVDLKYHFNTLTPEMNKLMENARLPLWALDPHDHDLENLRIFREKNHLEKPMTENQAYYYTVCQEKVKPSERVMLPEDRLDQVIEAFKNSETLSLKHEKEAVKSRFAAHDDTIKQALEESRNLKNKETLEAVQNANDIKEKVREEPIVARKELPKKFSVISRSEYNDIVRAYNSFSKKVSGLTKQRSDAVEEGKTDADLHDLDHELFRAKRDATRYKRVIDYYKNGELYLKKEPQHTNNGPAAGNSGKGKGHDAEPDTGKGMGGSGRQS